MWSNYCNGRTDKIICRGRFAPNKISWSYSSSHFPLYVSRTASTPHPIQRCSHQLEDHVIPAHNHSLCLDKFSVIVTFFKKVRVGGEGWGGGLFRRDVTGSWADIAALDFLTPIPSIKATLWSYFESLWPSLEMIQRYNWPLKNTFTRDLNALDDSKVALETCRMCK